MELSELKYGSKGELMAKDVDKEKKKGKNATASQNQI